MARPIRCVATAIIVLMAGAAAGLPAGTTGSRHENTVSEVTGPSCTRARLYPVCRRVGVTKKKPHVEYDVKCELVCVPGCSLLESCRNGCTCGNAVIREKKSLLKNTTEKEVQSYEYKIFWVCRSCAFGGGCSSALGDSP